MDANRSRRGRRTPKDVEDYIVNIYREDPSLSQPEIAERVETELGVDSRVDKSTVGRILRRANVERVAASGHEVPLLARDAHWPALRQTAEDLRVQVNGGIPFAQVLGFPWRTVDYNGGLVISGTGSVRLSLTSEESQLFGGLQEHLPSHKAWSSLSSWRRQGRALHDALHWALEQVMEDPELKGHSLITREDIENGADGITDFFPKSIALERAEQACGLGPKSHEFEVIEPSNARLTLLRWTRYSSSYVDLAASDNPDDLERLKKVHREIGERLLAGPEMATVERAYGSLGMTTKTLDSHLERIALLVEVPGTCSLYSASS